MPHVASPSLLLAAELRACLRRLRAKGIGVVCVGGASHVLSFDGGNAHAVDHDATAEAVLSAVGGAPPPCIRLVDHVPSASSAELWTALTSPLDGDDLQAVSAPDLRVLFARAIQNEFAAAGSAVRDSVAQLGLAVLGAGDDRLDRFGEKFRITRQLPRWDPGPGPWTDRELVLLSRCVRATPGGDDVPHLELLPSDPDARRAVAKYARNLLDEARVHTTEELRTALAPTFRNVRALTVLLVGEGLLEPTNGRYRVRTRLRPSRLDRRPLRH